MKYRTLAALGAATIALSGCATVIKGTTQSIVITTPPVSGAYCILSSAEGNWPVTTPNVVTVDKSKEDILVKCAKAGYQEASASIPSDFQGWTLGNLVLGGIIGVGVDAATGAMNEYPRAFAIPMIALAGPAPGAAGAGIVSGQPGDQRDLGITGSTVTPFSSISVGLPDPHGAFITTIKPDGPAFRAGLQTGDIVQTFNGLRVDTYDDLTKIVSTTATGAVVQLGVIRKGHRLDVAVQL